MLDTYKLNIAPCKGCGACECYKGCVDKDDTNPVVDKLVDADVIVFATPVYWWGVTAQIKMVIDKCYCKGTLIKGQFKCISEYLGWDLLFYEPIYAYGKGDLAKDENEIQKLIRIGENV